MSHHQKNGTVVASLPGRSQHPFSSVAMSPNRRYCVIAGKDTIQIAKVGHEGLKPFRKLQVSQHFQTGTGPDSLSQTIRKGHGDVRDAFNLAAKQQPRSRPGMVHVNVAVTCVAWSMPQKQGKNREPTKTTSSSLSEKAGSGGEELSVHDEKSDSIIAVAGSNGVVVVWNARQTFFTESTSAGGYSSSSSSSSTTLANQKPEAILSQHTRAVNALAWHRRRPGLLLTASQDATVRLWERREDITRRVDQEASTRMRFGFFSKTQEKQSRMYSWSCKATFEPKSEAIRDIAWSKFQDDHFALVTVSGSLVVYNIHLTIRALVKIVAHTGDATSLDWHPTRPYVIATGGSGDRCVKVWDLESSLDLNRAGEAQSNYNSNTWNTVKSEVSANSASSSETDKSSGGYALAYGGTVGSTGGKIVTGLSQGAFGRHKGSSAIQLHVLSISSAVTKLKWRPPALSVGSSNTEVSSTTSSNSNNNNNIISGDVDAHDSMLAVATARLTNAGGSGVVSLWSFHRPFMPLSVVEGHEEGAVADFVWLETPNRFGSFWERPQTTNQLENVKDFRRNRKSSSSQQYEENVSIRSSLGKGEIDTNLIDSIEDDQDDYQPSGAIWQHVLTVGRDGRCIIQSLLRGHRPIMQVPSSCFAMANLSPFQAGYGSLQFFSVYQRVPNGPSHDAKLTALRQDESVRNAPGIFKEDIPKRIKSGENVDGGGDFQTERRLPATMPDLVFNVVDHGNLTVDGLPVEKHIADGTNKNTDITNYDDDEKKNNNNDNNDNDFITRLCIAPEVVHLSRFADRYKFYPDNNNFKTRVDLCLHNANVAEELKSFRLARMWRSISSILHGSGLDVLPSRLMTNNSDNNNMSSASMIVTKNVMQFTLFPTIKSLLLERAEAGDVQTCVAVCEVLQVIEEQGQDNPDGQQKLMTRIPGLELNLVREWYLSYIDLLQQMCLFSAASYLIRSCKDPYIGALNKQSTTIHESCPRCGKPLQPETEGVGDFSSGGGSSNFPSARRACKNCRRRVGLCFLCHEPVRGMFVWCPGCGHGGHLEHALQWFGGLDGKPVREVCPTGCGHKCNLTQMLNAFPRTDSMVSFQLPSSESTMCLPAK